MNWSSSLNYAYINSGEIVVNKFNSGIINRMDKKYAIAVGDQLISNHLKIPIYDFEDRNNILFNLIKE